MNPLGATISYNSTGAVLAFNKVLSMQCPHCGIEFQPAYISFGRLETKFKAIGGNLEPIALPDFVERPEDYPREYPEGSERVAWACTSTACTKCRQPILDLVKSVWGPLPPPEPGNWRDPSENEGYVEEWRQRIYCRSDVLRC